MAKRDILPIFPSRANSVIMKQRVLAARRGVGLLKRKRDAIDLKLRELKRQLNEKDELADMMMCDAIFTMAKARLLGADFRPQIVSASKVDATNIRRTHTKIVGVTLNCLDLEKKSGAGPGYPLAGLSCGGVQAHRIREAYYKALEELVASASILYQVRMLEAASLQTNMRVNALEHVVIPILQNTSNYITGELEEFEREDFYRLKRSQAKQMEAKLAFSELIKTKNMTVDELEFYMKRHAAAVHPVADVQFDPEEFFEDKVKQRKQEARLSLKLPADRLDSKSVMRMDNQQLHREPSIGARGSYINKETFMARSSQFRNRLVEQIKTRKTLEGIATKDADDKKANKESDK